MRILLVEDNLALAHGLVAVLKSAGDAVDHIRDGADAEAAIAAGRFDLVILDLTLPGMDGLELLRSVRGRGDATPVLVLTARGELDDRIRGLDLGADDYMTKPFEVREFEARVRALLRRGAGLGRPAITVGGLELDLTSGAIEVAGVPLELTRREMSILRTLAMARGRVVQKQALLDALTGYDDLLSENAVEQYVSRLRRRLQPHGVAIRVARGLGYWIESQAQ